MRYTYYAVLRATVSASVNEKFHFSLDFKKPNDPMGKWWRKWWREGGGGWLAAGRVGGSK